MSELREADDAIQQRQEAISEALARATGLEQTDIYRHLFVGMDLKVPEVRELAAEHAAAACMCALEEGGTVDFADYLAASWMDGFSVAAMLFLRRSEGNLR